MSLSSSALTYPFRADLLSTAAAVLCHAVPVHHRLLLLSVSLFWGSLPGALLLSFPAAGAECWGECLPADVTAG